MSDRIVVMHHGKVVEQGDADEICENPRHDYTQRCSMPCPRSSSGAADACGAGK
jgi:ABC-type dipeptide/oligopeptide/nickel transport system ATPase component